MSLCPLRILKWICKGTEQRLGIFFLQITSDGFVHEGEYGSKDRRRMTIRVPVVREELTPSAWDAPGAGSPGRAGPRKTARRM